MKTSITDSISTIDFWCPMGSDDGLSGTGLSGGTGLSVAGPSVASAKGSGSCVPVFENPVFYRPDGLEANLRKSVAPAALPADDDGSDDDGHGHPANDDPEL